MPQVPSKVGNDAAKIQVYFTNTLPYLGTVQGDVWKPVSYGLETVAWGFCLAPGFTVADLALSFTTKYCAGLQSLPPPIR